MAYEQFKAPVPTLTNTRYTFRVQGLDADIELPWRIPSAANPANCIPVPADQVGGDVQTFIFGPMTHALTVRPHRPAPACCSQTFSFDLAGGMFGAKVGSAEVVRSCCSVDVKATLPGGQQLTGTIERPCCGIQPRSDLKWNTGEVVSQRAPPGCACCGPWRVGTVGSVPSEEENNQIRYWDMPWMYITCDIGLAYRLCCAMCCASCRTCCECRDRFAFTTWEPFTLEGVRGKLLNAYAYKLYSAFGEPNFEPGTDFQAVGLRSSPHLSDINALGNVRLPVIKKGCCCDFVMADPSDSSDPADQAGFDMMFRGTFNQNEVAPQDFNIVLGYTLLQATGFVGLLAARANVITAAQRTIPSSLKVGEVRPRPSGSKMV